MRGLRALRPTLIESCLAAVLLTLSLAEALLSDEQPAPTVGPLVAAAIPPLAVAFSRVWPEGAAGALIVVLAFVSLQPSASGTLGAGFSWLAIIFGVAAWSRHAWPWLLALVASSIVRDVRTLAFDATDLAIDLAFIGFTVAIGRVVHRRTAQADALATRLDLADADRDTATREAVARERAVIARELHDIVAHSVSLMVVQAGTARPIAQRVDRELAEVLETIEHAGREALTELRRLLHVLRSDEESDLQPLPDLTRLDSLVDGFRSAGLNLRATISPPVEVPPGIALCAYRTVQEGLTNALRYAPEGRIDVDVVGEAGNLLVRVRDHGGTTTADGLGSGSGLVGLHERVLLCGGRMTAGSDHAGYLLSVTLPLPDPGLPAPEPEPVEGGVHVIRVVVADDQELVRQGFTRLLRDVADIEVVGEAEDGSSAVTRVVETRPDVVLMDVRMPGMDGVEATARIVRDAPSVRVLMLTTFDLDESVHRALEAGASGFLLKDTPYDQLIHAIRAVSRGDAVLAPSVTRRLIDTLTPQPDPTGSDATRLGRLTDRELEVLRLIADGMSNAEIGRELFLSEPTVKTHVGRLLTKLGCRDRVQATVFAFRSGFVPRT